MQKLVLMQKLILMWKLIRILKLVIINSETRFGQVVNCRVHHPSGGNNLAFSHCGGIEKNRKLQICMDFQKLNTTTKRILILYLLQNKSVCVDY
jgi:hypothetical protein